MKSPARIISGNVVQFNISPKGSYESFMIMDARQLVQVNFPHGGRAELPEQVKVGKEISVHAIPFEDDHAFDHPVYELLAEDGDALVGKVKQINFAKHGQPNGVILETGEFVHTRPHGAKALKFKVGQELKVLGEVKTSLGGLTVIEATSINGIDIEHPKGKRH